LKLIFKDELLQLNNTQMSKQNYLGIQESLKLFSLPNSAKI